MSASRADNIRADITRIGSMSDAEFEQQWGEWCRRHDRDITLMRERWLRDLDTMLWYAQQEQVAVNVLIEAKERFREDPSEMHRFARDEAAAAVQRIRSQERERRGDRVGVIGDAFVSGTR